MSGDRLAAVALKHVEQVPSFALEGHLYKADDGRQFYVFTAGDGTVWSATEPGDHALGHYLVRSAPSRSECVKQLARVLNNQR